MHRKLMSTKVDSCSMFANRHHRRQRPRFSSVGSNTKPVDGAASGLPVTGLTIRGT